MEAAQIDAMTDRVTEVFAKQKKKSQDLRSENITSRITRLKKLKTWIEKNRPAIQQAVYADFKKPKSEVDITEVYPVISEIKHAISNLKSWTRPVKVDAPLTYLGSTSYIQYEPKGVCLVLSPWNYPFSLAVGPLISALAAGNTVMVKPSEMTPNTAALIDTMIGEVFPENEVAAFQGGVEKSQELLALPFDHIFFTGSPSIGKVVMAAAANHLSGVTLELGGKSPTIIDKSANLKDAAEKIAWGKFLNIGQTCLAPDYIVIDRSVEKEFLPYLIAAVKKQFDSNSSGFNQSPDYARIVNNRHFKRLNALIADAVEKGANVAMGGDVESDTNFIPPTILTNVSMDSLVMEEEIFGPILPIVPYDSLEHAIQLINSKPKPLALYYFGQNRKNRNQVLLQTSSGGVCINDCVLQFSHHNLPFGGVNNSGFGKSHGKYGFLAFSNEKPVLKQRIGFTASKVIYPPYTRTVSKLINAIIKYL